MRSDGCRSAAASNGTGSGQPSRRASTASASQRAKKFGIGAVRQHGFHRVGRGERRPPARSRELLGRRDRAAQSVVDGQAQGFGEVEDRTRRRADRSGRVPARPAASGRPVRDRRRRGRGQKNRGARASSSPRRTMRALAAAALSARRRRHTPDQGAAAWTRVLSAASAAPAEKAVSTAASAGSAGGVSWRAQPGNGLSTGTGWDVPSPWFCAQNHGLA